MRTLALHTFSGIQHCCNMSVLRLGTCHHILVTLLVVAVVLRRGWCQDDGEAVVTEQLQDAGGELVSTHTHARTHTHTCTRTYIHMHTHTHTHTHWWPLTSDPEPDL